jgi:long-chain acyl-CoA synthetase
MLEETAARFPRRKSLIVEKSTVDYAALNARSNRYAHAFRLKLGCKPFERVALLLENDEDFIYTCFGALKAGAVVVPLNTFLTAPEFEYILNDAAVKVLVTSDRFASLVRRFSDRIRSLESIVTVGREDIGKDTWLHEELLKGMPETNPEDRARRNHDAVIIYTSGTTGKPKGAILTHENLLSNVVSSGRSVKITKRDRLLLVLPMFHSFTITACIFMPVAVGARIIVVEKLRSLSHVLKSALFHRATIFIGIPHIYDVMAQRPFPWWIRLFLKLRLCVSGSAPLAEATLKGFEEKLKIPLLEGYGLSETSPVVSINPLQGVRKPGSVGRPIPEVSVSIFSGSGEMLPPGEIGEIAVKGPNVMRGYLNHPRETKETIRGGWLFTGDIGKMDEDGYIYILDRKKDMILFHGMNVYPREIEEVLYGHPAVVEAAVVGKPDTHRGEIPVAFVSLRNGEDLRPADLIRFCRRSLAAYKVPHTIRVLDKLPRTATGKILKRDLKNRVARLTTAAGDVINSGKEG